METVYYVYILKSYIANKYYIGQTSDLERRILYHNSGYSKFTKPGIPWELVYVENYRSRQLPVRREAELKKLKSRVMIEKIISDQSS